jgi:hypothetical protein
MMFCYKNFVVGAIEVWSPSGFDETTTTRLFLVLQFLMRQIQGSSAEKK